MPARHWGQLTEPAAARPVSGLTPADVVSQLIYRMSGPLPGGADLLMDVHGLSGRPATHQRATAARHGIPADLLRQRRRELQREAQLSVIAPSILQAAGAPSGPFDDHLARRAVAQTLGAVWPVSWSPSAVDRWAVGTCVRVLSVVGPLDLDCLTRAIGRTRRSRTTAVPSAAHLGVLLAISGLVNRQPDGLWHLITPQPQRMRYQALSEAMGRSEFTHQAMIRILIDSGYAASSAHGQSLARHPLIERLAYDRYTLIGSNTRLQQQPLDAPAP